MIKKLFIAIQYVLVALVAAFFVWAWARPKLQPDRDPATWRSWNGFMAIAYAGVGREASEQYPSPGVVADHLAALREAGYKPIRPEDVAAFLAGRAPLPDRALLILFEGGRKDSLVRATPLLARTGFIGTLVVPTEFVGRWGSAFLKKPDIRNASRIPHWALASMGHRAIDEIPVDASGRKGRFLSHRMWTDGRVEDDSAFERRIAGDYHASLEVLEQATHAPVVAYVYPYGDAGTGPGSDPQAAAINLDAVSGRFSVAFTGADDPFNGPNSDPFNLTRLRVPGTWTGERLVDELRKFEPRMEAVSGFDQADRWFHQKNSSSRNGGLLLPAGSLAWLRGSDGWTDFECGARVKVEDGGVASIYLRHASPASYLRVTLDGRILRMQERLVNRMLGLASVPLAAAAPDGYEIRARIRGNRAWIWLDGRQVAGPLPLAPETDRGRIGFGSEGAATAVGSFDATPSPGYYAFAASYGSIPEDQRTAVSAVLPIWFEPGKEPVVESTQRADALAAAASGVETIPVVANSTDLKPDESEVFASGIAAALSPTTLKPLITQIAIAGYSENLSRSLRAKGYRIVHLLKPEYAREVCRIGGLKDAPYDRVFLDAGPEQARELLNELLHVCPARRIIVRRDAGTDVPLGVRIAVLPQDLQKEDR